MDLIQTALTIANEAHWWQFRADGKTPYINHPILVSLAVEEAGGDQYAIAAALLHDVFEDTKLRPSDIVHLVGSEVVQTVVELTYPSGMPDRRKRMIERAPNMSKRAKLVKLGDIFINLIDLPGAPWTHDKAKRYYTHLCAMRDALEGTSPKLEAAFDAASAHLGEHYLD